MTITYQERLNLYEIAQETIGFMMAIRTASIHEEGQKSNPDAGKIAQWNQEFDRLDDELYGLRFDDDVAIQRVLDEYCPLVKAEFEKGQTAT